MLCAGAGPAAAVRVPERNFIDAEIFGKLGSLGVAPAQLSTDEEFLRRICLDLTGRIPLPAEIRAFLADASAAKRDQVIDRLIYSPEFEDRWVLWLGDLLSNKAAGTTFSPQIGGRNAFHNYLRQAMATGKSLRDIAWEVVAASGNSFDDATGAANFAASSLTPGGLPSRTPTTRCW
jgi:hypothetical protein